MKMIIMIMIMIMIMMIIMIIMIGVERDIKGSKLFLVLHLALGQPREVPLSSYVIV